MRDKLLIICGPTATGKTKVAVSLAKKFNGELVSADSRQVYRGMDIATGKDVSEIGDVPIWMIDVVSPDEEFSVSNYVTQARAVIEDIRKRGKLPIVVGGTGFYISALISPFETLHVAPDKNLRDKLSNASFEELQKNLRSLNPTLLEGMNVSDRMNPRRLIRKIEIASSVKKNMSSRVKNVREDVLVIGLTAPYKELYKRIDARVDARVAQGIVKEIETLLGQGYSWNLPSMNTLGYKQWKDASSSDEAIARWKYDEHAYARRQMTWFRKKLQIVWFNSTSRQTLSKVTRKVSAWYTQKEAS